MKLTIPKKMEITITLTNGQKYKLRNPGSLYKIDSNRTAIFLFDDMNVYTGCSNGLIDEDEDFCIFLPGKYHGIGMPFKRLVGWEYKTDREITQNEQQL